MNLSEVGVLAGLALADSTSVGTLIIPVWLLMRDRFDMRRTLLYLTVIAVFYWTVSMGLLAFMTRVTALSHSIPLARSWSWGQLTVGLTVLIIGWWIDQRPGSDATDHSRTRHWRDRTRRLDGNGAMVGLALMAGLMELATMLPLLTAVGILERSHLTPLASVLAVTGYVALMMSPACVLLAARAALGERMGKPLASLSRRLEALAHTFTATILMAVGGLVSADAAISLNLLS